MRWYHRHYPIVTTQYLLNRRYVNKVYTMKTYDQLRLQLVNHEPFSAHLDYPSFSIHGPAIWRDLNAMEERGFELSGICGWLRALELRGTGTVWSMNIASTFGAQYQRRRVTVFLEGIGKHGPVISITGCDYCLLCEVITDELTGVHTLRLHRIIPLGESYDRRDRVQRNQAVKFASSKWFAAQKAATT